jgi:hypothetical protein
MSSSSPEAVPNGLTNNVPDAVPGKTFGIGLEQKAGEAVKKSVPVVIVVEKGAAINSTNNDMLKQSGNIYTGISRHRRILQQYRLMNNVLELSRSCP